MTFPRIGGRVEDEEAVEPPSLSNGGRYLKVIYSQDDDGEGIFVITAYDLPRRQLRALQRRLRRRRQ